MNEEINMMQEALKYAQMGFAVFPVCSRNKKPHTPNGCLDAKRDPGAIKFWWNKWKDASIGIATGSISNGLIVVDLDMDEQKGLDGYHALQEWERVNGTLPDSWRSITGRGGYHIFYKSKEVFGNRTSVIEGVDVRGEGGYIIAPPSLHPNGNRYEWETAPEDVPLAEVDETVRKLITLGLKEKESHKFELPATIANGTRNDILFKYACSLQSKAIPNDAILDYVMLANTTRCADPLPDDEVQTLVESALGYEKGSLTKPSFSGWHEPVLKTYITKKNGEEVEVPRQTIANCIEAITYDRDLFRRLKYNELAYAPYVHGSLPWDDSPEPREWNNTDDANLKNYLESNYGLHVTDKIMDALVIVTDKNRFNPVKDMLDEKYDVWLEAGKPTGCIRGLLPYWLGAEDSDYNFHVLRIFMLGAICRAYYPGCKFDYVPILTGQQGCGKSTFLRYLAAGNDWFVDSFNTVETDRATEKLRGLWMVELAELLAVKRAKDVEALKSFLTSTEDSFRPPYQRRTERRPRMCVFAGSTNSDHFLTDRTGNRRFLPVQCRPDHQKEHPGENKKYLMETIALAWGEAMQIFKDAKGKPELVLPKEIQKIAEQEQLRYTEEDVRIGVIQSWLDKFQHDRTCVLEIWEEALKMDVKPSRAESNALHEIMTNDIEGWQKVKGNNGRTRCREYGVQICYERISQQTWIDLNQAEKVPFD